MTMKVLEKTIYKDFVIHVAGKEHETWVETIIDEMAKSA
ncbi:MAG: hypothetical protein ACI9K1_000585, partial [Arcticibacterium sp.]